MPCLYITAGVIKKVQGFASRSVGLVDTRPEISEEEAVQTLRDQWNHTKTVEEVEVRLDDPELQVLHTVSSLLLPNNTQVFNAYRIRIRKIDGKRLRQLWNIQILILGNL